MASSRPVDKQSFMQLFAYLLNNVDNEKLIEDDMDTIYMTGMQYYEKHFGNAEKNKLTVADVEFLICLQDKPLWGEEIKAALSIDIKTSANRINKSLEKGLISTFYEGTGKNRKRYYSLTHYGRQRLYDTILNFEELGFTFDEN